MSGMRSVSIAVLLCTIVAACGDGGGGGGSGPGPQAPATLVARVDILPPILQATPGSQVILQARLVNEDDELLPWKHVPGGVVPPDIWWDVPSGIQIVGNSSTGPFIGLKMPAEGPAGFDTPTFTIRAQLVDPNLGVSGLVPGSATIAVIGTATPSGVVYDSVGGLDIGFPQIARIRGPAPAGGQAEWWLAFVGAGRFPDLGSPPGITANVGSGGESADLLAVFERFRSIPTGWTAGAELVERPVAADAPTEVSIRVWKAVTALETSGTPVDVSLGDVRDLAVTQLRYADIIFRLNRVGVRLDTLAVVEYGGDLELEVDFQVSMSPLVTPDGTGSPVDACSYLANQASSSSSSSQTFAATSSVVIPHLEVFFIRDLDFGRGYACVDEPVLLIEYRDAVANGVMAHELGHRFGLRGAVGHTDLLPGFEPWNLMRSAFSDAVASERAHLSIGQVYRMNRHESSAIHMFRPDPPVDCGPSSAGNAECPALAFDVSDLVAASP